MDQNQVALIPQWRQNTNKRFIVLLPEETKPEQLYQGSTQISFFGAQQQQHSLCAKWNLNKPLSWDKQT